MDSALTKPCEVDGDLLPKVLSNVIQRLVLVPLAPACPVLIQDLTWVQRSLRYTPLPLHFVRTLSSQYALCHKINFDKVVLYKLLGLVCNTIHHLHEDFGYVFNTRQSIVVVNLWHEPM